MNRTKSIDVVIASKVSRIADLWVEKYNMQYKHALDLIYSSNIYKKLTDLETGLYFQGLNYLFHELEAETKSDLKNKKQ